MRVLGRGRGEEKRVSILWSWILLLIFATMPSRHKGASVLTGKEKKEYEAKKIMRLGGKAPKNIKTPIKILKGMKIKQKERETKKLEEV